MPKAQQLQYGCVLDKHYPSPIINIQQATRSALTKIIAARKQLGAHDETQAIIKKHASSKGLRGGKRDVNGPELASKSTQKKSKINVLKLKQRELF